jgi:energy-coupling factor transporter ATP-binding protein EcfA2
LQPEILVLDEPTSQLDPQAAEEVLVALRHLNEDLGLTVVLSEHRLERVVQYADRVIYMPALGQPPILDEPRAVMAALPLIPPLIELGRKLNWQPLPLTIKEGRVFARGLGKRIGESANQRMGERESGRNGKSANQQIANAPVVSVKGVQYAYDGHAALRGVSFEAAAGEFVALMGRNGSGKSTLLKQVIGLLKPDQGQVVVSGLDTRRAALDDVIRIVGYVPQHPGALLFQETLADELAFTRRSHRMPPDPEGDLALLARLGLEGLGGRNPRDLSGGEQQRAALAAILVADPTIILLDEPTRGLDYEQKHRLAGLLIGMKREGRTIIMATHDVELAAACADRVVLMAEGQIVVDGPARNVMSDSLVFSSQINKLFRDPRFLVVEDVLDALGER